jgi:hypothetical protein
MSDTQTVEAPVEAKPAKSVKTPHACACSLYTVHTDEGDVTTECTAQTVRSFVPGHDAKLKSMLIKAAINGQEVTREATDQNPEAVLSAREAAEDFNFAAHIDKGVETHEKREAAKAERKAASDAKKAEAADKKAVAEAEKKAVRDAKKAEAAAKREAAAADREAKKAAKDAEREAKKAAAEEEKARKAAEKAEAAAKKAEAAAAANEPTGASDEG